MENNSYIEFKKERDLGAIITDTFKFIRENWKPYFGAIIKIVGPFILAGAVIMVFTFGAFSGIFSEIGDSDPDAALGVMGSMFGWIGLLILVAIVIYVMISATSLYFIKSYINNNGIPDFIEIRTNTFKNIWKFVGLGILIFMIVIIGIVLCYAPGIYLGVVLSLATAIMVFEDKSIGDTISHSFTLIKDQWWSTFGVLLVVGLLVSILGSVFSIPTFMYQMIKMGTMVGEDDPTGVFNLFKDPIYVTLNVISYIGKYILSSVTLIATVFIYFDLNEQKNLTGTIEKIDSLGQ